MLSINSSNSVELPMGQYRAKPLQGERVTTRRKPYTQASGNGERFIK